MLDTLNSRYRIIDKLGAGGMGEVYLAEDLHLGRKVAIKILVENLKTDPEANLRFAQEARSASALNHPSIVTIHEITADQGHQYIVMEFVEGDTLRHLLERGAVDVTRALEIVAQAASGLAAAHSAGIIHRDIKPENLIVTSRWQSKILDFGLSKLVEKNRAAISDSEASTKALSPAVRNRTAAGVIVGTVGYMSPEQAETRPVDHRTDIFSLGVVLYELLSGSQPFTGSSIIDTLHAITTREPTPIFELNPKVPLEAADILDKALAKDAGERYQHAGDLELDLRRLKRAIETNSLASRRSEARSVRFTNRRNAFSKVLLIVGFLVCILAAAWLGHRFSGRSAPDHSTSRAIATRLTNYGGSETAGAISPDGRSFAFVSEQDGNPDLWVRQIAGGEPVRLTNDSAEEADPIYAPDGETIYFTRIEGDVPSIWRIGVLGGQARRIVSNARSVAPSPDGKSISYLTLQPHTAETAVAVSALDGSGTRLISPKYVFSDMNARPVWSPDGHLLAYNRWGLFTPNNLFVTDIATGHERQVTQFAGSSEGIQAMAWLPDNRHLVVCYVPERSSIFQNDLALLDLNDGSFSRLTFNTGIAFGDLSLSADGNRLIATVMQTNREMWKVPLGADADSNGRSTVKVLDSSQDPMWTFASRDGRTLLFNNATTGTRNLWTMPLDRSEAPHQITMIEGDNVMHSSLSEDGLRVAFVSRVKGHSDIWTQNVDGSDLRQLTNDEAADAWPVWSPDGQWIMFASLQNGNWETWRVLADGGAPEKFIDGFFRGDWIRKPVGDGTLVVTSFENGGMRLIDVEQRTIIWESRFGGSNLSFPVFSPDGRFISVARQESRDRDAIWIYETATGRGHAAVRFQEPFRIAFRASWIENGKALLVNRYQNITHVSLFDRFWLKTDADA